MQMHHHILTFMQKRNIFLYLFVGVFFLLFMVNRSYLIWQVTFLMHFYNSWTTDDSRFLCFLFLLFLFLGSHFVSFYEHNSTEETKSCWKKSALGSYTNSFVETNCKRPGKYTLVKPLMQLQIFTCLKAKLHVFFFSRSSYQL